MPTEYIIRGNEVLRRDYNDYPLDVRHEALAMLSAGVSRGARRLGPIGGNYGNCSLTLHDKGFGAITTRVLNLPLNCRFRLQDKVMSPVFENTDEELPTLNLKWKVPDSMRLLFMVAFSEASDAAYAMVDQYLFAWDASRIFRLPLSNVYDTCKLCHGISRATRLPSVLELLKTATTAFDASQWNKDLYMDGKDVRAETRGLFRFSPENETMKQLDPTRNWMDLCVKVGSPDLLKWVGNPNL